MIHCKLFLYLMNIEKIMRSFLKDTKAIKKGRKHFKIIFNLSRKKMCTNLICRKKVRKETHYPAHNSHRKMQTRFQLSRFAKLISIYYLTIYDLISRLMVHLMIFVPLVFFIHDIWLHASKTTRRAWFCEIGFHETRKKRKMNWRRVVQFWLNHPYTFRWFNFYSHQISHFINTFLISGNN